MSINLPANFLWRSNQKLADQISDQKRAWLKTPVDQQVQNLYIVKMSDFSREIAFYTICQRLRLSCQLVPDYRHNPACWLVDPGHEPKCAERAPIRDHVVRQASAVHVTCAVERRWGFSQFGRKLTSVHASSPRLKCSIWPKEYTPKLFRTLRFLSSP